jgi:hypothetical protein
MNFKHRGFSVDEISRNGVVIDGAATLSVTVNNYYVGSLWGAAKLPGDPKACSTGVTGPCYSATGKNPLQELVKYLKNLPQPVAPPALGRITQE